jgi:predicted nucleic acid-binding protein
MIAPAGRGAGGAGAFGASRERVESLVGLLDGEQAAGLSHFELEERLQTDGRELLRQLFEDHLSVRAERERSVEGLVGADLVARRTVEAGRERGLASVFGDLRVSRLAYRARGAGDLHLADALLNLPVERHSHGLRRLAAIESSRGSYDDAGAAIWRATGQRLGKRQVEDLAARAAVDFDAFYAQHERVASDDADVLVVSCDGKGVVMRPGALRPATAKAAKSSTTKLKTRLSKGEKRNRKRIAEVGAVYDLTPVPRAASDVMPETDADRGIDAPAAKNKWLTASVIEDAADVVARVFDEAQHRDPDHDRTWVALVDGNNHQIDRIRAEARARGAPITILVDFIHVLEYLWKAAWSFHQEGDPAAEAWVRRHALQILDGRASKVAGNIRRQATKAGMPPAQRAGADTAAKYLTNKAPLLDYPTALAAGWPIATGVIEGACRHLVKDRMDITGARWGLPGAEAILKLRAIVSNDDFDAYWRYHLAQEHRRVHQSRYPAGEIPHAA